eukprot:PhM_4_TR9163/c0_g1_i1/m.40118/K08489/STX16; syntaxin 16
MLQNQNFHLCTRSRFKDFSDARDYHVGRHRVSLFSTSKKQVDEHKQPLVEMDGSLNSTPHMMAATQSSHQNSSSPPSEIRCIVSEFDELETELRRNTTELETIQRKQTRAHFRSAEAEAHDAHLLAEATQHLTTTFKRIDRRLIELDVTISSKKGAAAKDTRSILQNMKIAYATKFAGYANTFRENQSKFVVESQRQKRARGGARRKFVAAPGIDETLVSQLEREEAMETYMDRGLTEDQAQALLQHEDEAKARDAEIKDLLDSLTSLHDVFKDMNTLVIEQGTVLDQIDYNLVRSHEKISSGVTELVTARKSQQAGRFKLLVLFLVMLIFGFLFAIVVKGTV